MARNRRCYGKIQAQDQPLSPSPVVPNSETKTQVDAENVNSNGVTSEVKVPEKRAYIRKSVKTVSLAIRRSGRIVNSPVQVNYMEPSAEEIDVAAAEEIVVAAAEEIGTAAAEEMDIAAVEKITVAENDKAEESPPDEENHTHEETENEPAETTNAANLNYRSLYISSQKKIKSLMKKKRELRKQLEKALAKIEVYTEITPILSSMSKSNEILCKREGSTKRFRT